MFWHMLFQFGVVQSVNFDAFCNAVSVRAVHQFQPIIQQIVTAQKFTATPIGQLAGVTSIASFLGFHL